eukprot:12594126-Alexandrium_andersonii.AAC.1
MAGGHMHCSTLAVSLAADRLWPDARPSSSRHIPGSLFMFAGDSELLSGRRDSCLAHDETLFKGHGKPGDEFRNAR